MDGLLKQRPFYPSYYTPMYNNLGFVLLSYVVEAITGKPFMPQIEEAIIKPLNLSYTFIKKPDDSVGAIPGDPIGSLWGVDFGNESP